MKIGPTGGVIIGILITIGLLYLYFNYGKQTPAPVVTTPTPPPAPAQERIIIATQPNLYYTTTRYSITNGRYYRVYLLNDRPIRFVEVTKDEYIQGIGGLSVYCTQNPDDSLCNMPNNV